MDSLSNKNILNWKYEIITTLRTYKGKLSEIINTLNNVWESFFNELLKHNKRIIWGGINLWDCNEGNLYSLQFARDKQSQAMLRQRFEYISQRLSFFKMITEYLFEDIFESLLDYNYISFTFRDIYIETKKILNITVNRTYVEFKTKFQKKQNSELLSELLNFTKKEKENRLWNTILFLQQCCLHNDSKIIYYFPIAEIIREKPAAGLLLSVNEPLNDKLLQRLYCNSFILLINLVQYYREYYSDTLAAKDTAIAIMTRNFSHNIGSHALEHIERDFRRRYFERFNNEDKELANFSNYLKERSTLWASVAEPFKSMVLGGEIKKISGEIIKDFNENKLLLKNLLRTELEPLMEKYKFDINVKIEGDKDVEIWWSEGLVGKQAFYEILENIIRNIKHWLGFKPDEYSQSFAIYWRDKRQKLLEQKKLDILINVSNHSDSPLVKVKIWDGLYVPEQKWLDVKKILDETRLFDSASRVVMKGINEIKISALILRGKDVSEWEDRSADFPTLSLNGKNGDQSRLEYILYLWRGEKLKIFKTSDEYNEFLEKEKQEEENPYRFSFLLKPATKEERIETRKITGRFGIIQDSKTNGYWIVTEHEIDQWKKTDDEYGEVYKSWLRYWIGESRLDNLIVIKSEKIDVKPKIELKFPIITYSICHAPIDNIQRSDGDVNCTVTIPYSGTMGLGKNINKIVREIDSNRWEFILEIIEVLETNIFILDDRIFKEVDITINKSLEAIKCKILEVTPDFSRETLMYHLSHWIEENREPLHFFAAHSSFLEELWQQRDEELVKWLSQLNFKEIVIISGKTTPEWWEDLSRKTRCVFLRYGNLKNWMKISTRTPDIAFSIKSNLVNGMLSLH